MHCHQVIYLETILPQGKQTFQGNKVKISKQTKILKIKQIKFQIYVYCLQIFRWCRRGRKIKYKYLSAKNGFKMFLSKQKLKLNKKVVKKC